VKKAWRMPGRAESEADWSMSGLSV
jgi:hypothetical protein